MARCMMAETEVWRPRYSLTHALVSGLTRIEATRVVVENVPLSSLALADLTRQARIRATHYSTRIEGNQLTREEAEQVISGERRVFHGRERDVAEVRNYWEALARVEEWAALRRAFTEDLVQRLAGLVLSGRRAKAAPYRTGQNAVRDAATGALVYLPPEAKEVPALMAALVRWTR